MKTCIKCHLEKSLDDYHKGRNACKVCRAAQKGANRPNYDLKYSVRKYSITFEQYEQMLEQQNGSCKICGAKPLDRRLDIDHDRACCNGTFSCGKCVRGLLCRSCNNGIGRFKDNSELLMKAAEYINGSHTT